MQNSARRRIRRADPLESLYSQVIARFEKEMPEVSTELEYGSTFQLLVAVILSAQCTDRRVNLVTPALFGRFPDAQSMAEADPDELFSLISSVTYPNSKTRYLLKASAMIRDNFGGGIPDSIDDLMKLPGVGRKTANVILSVVWNKAAMAVDTHVFRVCNRIGLTPGSHNPYQSERMLVSHIPDKIVPKAHHWFILHGRYVCKAQSPQCTKCFLSDICLFSKTKQNQQ